MQNVLVMNSKGGTGKSTLIDEFAFWLDRHVGPVPGTDPGSIYQIADMDRQNSLIHGTERVPGAAITLVDMPGEISDSDAAYAQAASLIVVPTHNSRRDRSATDATLRTIARSGARCPVIIVVNRWAGRTRQDRDFAAEGLRAWLNGLRDERALPNVYGVLILPESSAFRAAADGGRSVVTQAPRSTAARATDAVCEALWDALDTRTYDEWSRRIEGRPADGQWVLMKRKEN